MTNHKSLPLTSVLKPLAKKWRSEKLGVGIYTFFFVLGASDMFTLNENNPNSTGRVLIKNDTYLGEGLSQNFLRWHMKGKQGEEMKYNI